MPSDALVDGLLDCLNGVGAPMFLCERIALALAVSWKVSCLGSKMAD